MNNLNKKSLFQFFKAFILYGLVLFVLILGISSQGGFRHAVAESQNAALTCGQVLPTVRDSISACSGIGANQLCYGHSGLSAEFSTDTSATFGKAGDIVDLSKSPLQSLTSKPLDLEKGEWGTAVFKVATKEQDNTLTGQAVTFVVYGDTVVTNTTPDSAKTAPESAASACKATLKARVLAKAIPAANARSLKTYAARTEVNLLGQSADKQWYYIEVENGSGWVPASTVTLSCEAASVREINPQSPVVPVDMVSFNVVSANDNKAQCRDVPPSALFVQNPTGRFVTFTVNGAKITLGSSAVIRAEADGDLVFAVIEGTSAVEVNDKAGIVNGGQQLTIALGSDQAASDIQNKPQAIEQYAANNGIVLPGVSFIAGAAGVEVNRSVVPQSNTVDLLDVGEEGSDLVIP